jgi:hypothetical protein
MCNYDHNTIINTSVTRFIAVTYIFRFTTPCLNTILLVIGHGRTETGNKTPLPERRGETCPQQSTGEIPGKHTSNAKMLLVACAGEAWPSEVIHAKLGNRLDGVADIEVCSNRETRAPA